MASPASIASSSYVSFNSEDNTSQLEATVSYTSTKSMNFECEWMVKNISCHDVERGESIESPAIITPNYPGTTWHLQLFPRGYSSKQKDVAVGLFCYERWPARAWSEAAISVLNVNGKKCLTQVVKSKDCQNQPEDDPLVILCIGDKSARNIICGDKLTIVLEVWLAEVSFTLTGDPSESHTELVDDFGTMFKDQRLTDVVFKVEGREIGAHQLILAARSSVFAKMFENDQEDSKQGVVSDTSVPVVSEDGVVDITDVSYADFEAMLHFVYTDKVPCLKSLAKSLLAAANKFDLKKLKAMCQAELCSDLSILNVCDRLIEADKHNATHLKQSALKHISTHGAAIVKTDGWRSLVEQRPKLAAVAFEYLAVRTS